MPFKLDKLLVVTTKSRVVVYVLFTKHILNENDIEIYKRKTATSHQDS